jgi:hypothetical protein
MKSKFTTSWLAALVTLTGLALATASCSTDAGNQGTTGVGLDISGQVDSTSVDTAITDAAIANDTTGQDGSTVTDSGDGSTAVDVDDALTDADADDVTTLDCPGGPQCECTDNKDCNSSVCIENPQGLSSTGKECAATCTDDCSKGYTCATVNVGGDPVSICVPIGARLCDPCTTSKDCESIGAGDAACVDQGALGAFCGNACTSDASCPGGYVCKDVKTKEGTNSKQCVIPAPVGSEESYGVCACSIGATKKKLVTACTVPALDDKGNTIGTCAGERTCLSGGLSACTTGTLGKESCDGVDNDCNGTTDDGACDDGNPCTIDACDPVAKTCKTAPVSDGLDCDADGNACTSGDQCLAGQCVAGAKVNCNDNNPCTEDTCDPKTGCTKTTLDAVACDDDNPCTVGDVCQAGSCAAGIAKVCDSGDPCVSAKCSIKGGGNCVFTDQIEGLPCEDGNACTEKDACKSGSCTGGSLADCDDSNPCTSNTCDGKAGCVASNNNKPCDADGNACTVGDSCVGGACTAGNGTGCDDSNPCTVDSCDSKTGKCAFDGSKASGVPCNDDDVCSEKDSCTNGACKGSAKVCDDGNACTTDSCDAKQGCSSASSNAACDDGDACTQNDACAGNVCKGTAKKCDDGDPCTADSCDAKGGCKVTGEPDKTLCGVGKWCLSAKCVPSCADDCGKTGETNCDGDAVITCGNSDADLCLDWSTAKDCTAFETCKAGACVQKAAPYNIVINEIVYDAVGADNDVFVELYGPAGADLTGWTLVGVDGNGGKAYNAIDLKGKIPADGYFVIANTAAAKALLDVADQTASQADYQNGPDSIELRFGSKVVDALGYGVFAAATFAGEGLPAPDVDNGASIGRDSKSTDTDDNSKDFKAFDKPTPGAENVVANLPPVVALKCPSSASVGLKTQLDTTGTSDSDGQIVSCAVLVDGKEVSKAQTCSNLEVTFASGGTPKVTVVAVDDKGADASANCTISVSATNKPPVVSLSCPANVEVGKAANFDASKSTDADGSIKSFAWTYGDGTATSTGTSALANHVFDKAGNFEVSVVLTDDKGATASGSCVVAAKASNALPTAKLACPGSLVLGADGAFDGSGSTDSDGTIKSYTFVFSDGSTPAQGTASKVTRSFSKAGTVTVTLTVVDDVGGEGKASCTVPISASTPPDVVIVKPNADGNVTQGDAVAFIVDATAKGGKSVTQVSLLVDGKPVGTDTTAPYTFTWNVPANAVTGSKALVVATATDDASGVGSSTGRTLTIFNDPPKAAFSAVVSGALEAAVDGSFSSDAETANADLDVRWDWESDGTWDLDWSKTKVQKHKYAKAGSYTITMEVRDAVGQIAKTTRKVDLNLLQTVFGTVNTTTWVGTIIVTGNVTVPSGQTLTIAAGTSVQFAVVDQDANGKGDYSITIAGKMIVEGTTDEPVIFTHYGSPPAAGKGWDKILITGDGTVISNAIVEFADIGLQAQKIVKLNNVVFRKNRLGLYATTGGQPECTDCELSENLQEGALIASTGAIVFKGGKIINNGASGLRAESTSGTAAVQVDGATISGNKYVGLELLGLVSGLVTHCQITGNNYEGVRIARTGAVEPTIVVQYNNIWGNAKVGARVVKNVSVSASRSGSGSGAEVSTPYAIPGGVRADLVAWSYSESDSSYCTGSLRANTSAGAVMVSAATSTSDLSDIRTSNAKAIVAEAYKGTSLSYSATMLASQIVYDEIGAKREVSIARKTGTSDLRWNWFGDFPAILPLLTMTSPGAVTVQGFVGEKFGANWDRGIYYGGETAPADLTWSGTVYLTGDLSIAAGKTLTVEAGTQVMVVNHDQTGDGKGDFTLTSNGTLKSSGTAAAPVIFTSPGATGKTGQWQRINLTGASSKAIFTYTTVEYTTSGVFLGTGAHSFGDVTIRRSAADGLTISSANSVALTAFTASENTGRGVTIASSSNVTIDGATIQDNGSHGLQLNQSTSAITLSHMKVTKNTAAGLYLVNSTATIANCDATYNDIGVRYQGSCAGKLTMSNVKYNNYEGIYIASHVAANPTVQVVQNNLFGNGIVAAGALYLGGWSVSVSGNTSGSVKSPDWKLPGAAKIYAYQLGYSESDSSYCTGNLRRDSASGSSMYSFTTTSSTLWYDQMDSPVSILVGEVYKGTSLNYSATLSVPVAYYRLKDTGTEVTVMTTSGTLDCKGNYWGDGSFPNAVPKLALSRTNAVDVQGPQPIPISGTGPQK